MDSVSFMRICRTSASKSSSSSRACFSFVISFGDKIRGAGGSPKIPGGFTGEFDKQVAASHKTTALLFCERLTAKVTRAVKTAKLPIIHRLLWFLFMSKMVLP